jgi:hypothetical protein
MGKPGSGILFEARAGNDTELREELGIQASNGGFSCG